MWHILLSLCVVPFPHSFAHNSISSQEAANHAADAGISSTCPGIVRYHGLPVPAMLSCWTPGVPREAVPMRTLGRVLEAYWSSLRLRLLACVCDSCVPRALVCVFISLVVCVCPSVNRSICLPSSIIMHYLPLQFIHQCSGIWIEVSMLPVVTLIFYHLGFNWPSRWRPSPSPYAVAFMLET
jgi:hypothetical protein